MQDPTGRVPIGDATADDPRACRTPGVTATRRGVLVGVAAAVARGAAPAFARPRDVEYAIRSAVGEVTISAGHVSLGVPAHSDTGTSVPMTISVDCAMTEADYPKAVYVFADGNPRPRVLTVFFTPQSGRAEVSTRIRLEGAQTVTALAAMSDGTYRRDDAPVTVSFGACADVGSGPGPPRYLKPGMRVAVPPMATRGQTIPVRALIEHPMETGLRLNERNQYVPLRIIERFVCRYGDREVFAAQLEPAIATNPYFAFSLLAVASGPVEFEWIDTTGDVYGQTVPLKVT